MYSYCIVIASIILCLFNYFAKRVYIMYSIYKCIISLKANSHEITNERTSKRDGLP
jgi:hypothetical protein